jgi:Zn-dependent protease
MIFRVSREVGVTGLDFILTGFPSGRVLILMLGAEAVALAAAFAAGIRDVSREKELNLRRGLRKGAAWLALAFLPIGNAFTSDVLPTFLWMNVMLGGFNLLPGFPMDGGRIFRSTMRAFMSRAKATYVAMVVGRVFAVLLGLIGLQALFSGGLWGVVYILIAWMIWREGWREYQLAHVEEQAYGWGDWSARVSPPPYGGDDDEVEIRKN